MKIKIACKICGAPIDDYETFMDYEDDQTVVVNVGTCDHHPLRTVDYGE